VRQHFHSLDGSGYYDKSISEKMEANWWAKNGSYIYSIPVDRMIVPECCTAITNSRYINSLNCKHEWMYYAYNTIYLTPMYSAAVDWRNVIVKKHMRIAGRHKKIFYLPVADMTRYFNLIQIDLILIRIFR
jgi:hypothetical protein